MNAQTAFLYAGYAPSEYVAALVYTPEEEQAVSETRERIERRVKETAAGFTTGGNGYI